ncbi:hypothetical protein [Bacillus aquiflavi]|uniref:hypothetical protein n=1 Tax=Bacillus aquiflavi TaxID=2672567 RepID=UPI001FE7C641|nr:hypothetical protein [Bacillus aquiflavi]
MSSTEMPTGNAAKLGNVGKIGNFVNKIPPPISINKGLTPALATGKVNTIPYNVMDDLYNRIHQTSKEAFGDSRGGKVSVGVGEGSKRASVVNRPIQTIKNRYPNEVQKGKTFNITLINGNLKIRDGIKEVDFIIDVNNNLKVGRGHSHLASGKDVQAAGKLKVDELGNVRKITNESGHYTPTPKQAKNYEQIFKEAGIKTKNAWLEIHQLELTNSGYVNLGKLKKTESIKLK